MSEFNPGDRVRITAFGGSNTRPPVGETGTVMHYDRYYIRVQLDSGASTPIGATTIWPCRPEELERLTDPSPLHTHRNPA